VIASYHRRLFARNCPSRTPCHLSALREARDLHAEVRAWTEPTPAPIAPSAAEKSKGAPAVHGRGGVLQACEPEREMSDLLEAARHEPRRGADAAAVNAMPRGSRKASFQRLSCASSRATTSPASARVRRLAGGNKCATWPPCSSVDAEMACVQAAQSESAPGPRAVSSRRTRRRRKRPWAGTSLQLRHSCSWRKRPLQPMTSASSLSAPLHGHLAVHHALLTRSPTVSRHSLRPR